jgi:hypothetical protein
MISQGLKRIARAFAVPSAAEMENRYLDGSTSIHDLERRMAEVDRGAFRRTARLY